MRRRMKEFRFQRHSLLEDSAAHDSHTQIPSAIRKPEKKKKKKLLNRDVVIADYGRHLRHSSYFGSLQFFHRTVSETWRPSSRWPVQSKVAVGQGGGHVGQSVHSSESCGAAPTVWNGAPLGSALAIIRTGAGTRMGNFRHARYAHAHAAAAYLRVQIIPLKR